MYAKIKITGLLEVISGMHIGGSTAFSAIGSVDSPIIKDPLTGLPMLPGSSLKGKIRTLLARSINENFFANHDDDDDQIRRLFGSAKKNAVRVSRLLFSDSVMNNQLDLHKRGVKTLTEVKFENTINRATGVANPRQIERAMRGSEFPLEIIYELSPEENCLNNDDVIKAALNDLSLLAKGFKLLQVDYLGGSGSRGYGKIKIKEVSLDLAVGAVDENFIVKCNEIFKDYK